MLIAYILGTVFICSSLTTVHSVAIGGRFTGSSYGDYIQEIRTLADQLRNVRKKTAVLKSRFHSKLARSHQGEKKTQDEYLVYKLVK